MAQHHLFHIDSDQEPEDLPSVRRLGLAPVVPGIQAMWHEHGPSGTRFFSAKGWSKDEVLRINARVSRMIKAGLAPLPCFLQWVTCQQWLEVSEEVMNVASTDAWHNFHEMHAVLAAQAPERVVFCPKTIRVFLPVMLVEHAQ